MSYCDRKFENCLSEQRGWLSGCILNTYEKLLPTSMWVRRFNELPKLTMYICTTIYHLVFWGLFLYLAVTAYYHGVRDSWLSHDKSSGDCDEVSVALTGRFKADYNGNWESSPRYDDSRAVYAVQFSSYSRSGDELARDIARIDQAVDAVGEKVQYIPAAVLRALTLVDCGRASTETSLGTWWRSPHLKRAWLLRGAEK